VHKVLIALRFDSAISISSSQVGHHTTSASVASASDVACTLWHSSYVIDAVAPVPSVICEHITRWVHAILPDCILSVKGYFRVRRGLGSIQSICCLLGHLYDVGVVVGLLHVH